MTQYRVVAYKYGEVVRDSILLTPNFKEAKERLQKEKGDSKWKGWFVVLEADGKELFGEL